MNEMVYVIQEENAPARLKGKTITAIMTEDQLEFKVDLEEEPNEQESGYLRWFLGELIDQMKSQIKQNTNVDAENMFGLPEFRVCKDV